MTTGENQILLAVRSALSPRLSVGSHVCIGLSGGLDSVVLLHALRQLQTETPFLLSATHVHHGLSPNADSWAAFCLNLCESLKVSCEVVRLQLPDSAGKGVERVAREARYAAFIDAPGDILCLAHHQNDRAETFLLNLFRGAGATGLAGLPDLRCMGKKRLIRPFINISKADLRVWATKNQLRWIEDESNENLVFRRNYVRRQILPVVAKAFPGVVDVLARTSAQMTEQLLLLNRLAEIDSASCRNAAGHLLVSRLQQLPEVAIRNVLRYSLGRLGIQIPAARRLHQLSAQLMTATTDTQSFVRMGTVGVHLWRDEIWVDCAMDQVCPTPYEAKAGTVAWPDGQLKIEGALARGTAQVAPLGHAQRFQPAGRCRDRASELLRAQDVPPWIRPRLPVLRREDSIIWVGGLGWSNESAPEFSGDGFAVFWLPNKMTKL